MSGEKPFYDELRIIYEIGEGVSGWPSKWTEDFTAASGLLLDVRGSRPARTPLTSVSQH
jgi:hypothetical protein